MYILYIVWDAQQVQGDIDVYFVYCGGAQYVHGDIDIYFVYCVGCLVGTR